MKRETTTAERQDASVEPNDIEPWFYDDLDATRELCWQLLRRGVNDRHSVFHTPTLASTGTDGGPEARTVVLRGADSRRRRLRFHTDLRSDKARALALDPRVVLHFYDPMQKIQLRVFGHAQVHTDDRLADEAWRATRPFSRRCYRGQPGPGTALNSPYDFETSADAEGDVSGRENFAAVSVSIEAIEWLYLAARGHRRARFSWQDDTLKSSWLAP